MRRIRWKIPTLILSSLSAICLAAGVARAQSTSAPEKAAGLFEQIQSNALSIRDHAARVRSFARYPMEHSWRVDALNLDQMKTETNQIADFLANLKTLRDDAMPRQRQAFTRILPEATQMSDEIGQAIQLVNQNKEQVWTTDYSQTLDKIYNHADKIAQAVELSESMAEVRQIKKELAQK